MTKAPPPQTHWSEAHAGYTGSVKDWRKRFRQAAKDGRVRNRQSLHISREYDIPIRHVDFWRAKKSYINYNDPIHKAAKVAVARLRSLGRFSVPDGCRPVPPLAELELVWLGVRHAGH